MPWPTGTGRTINNTTQTQTATAVSTPPTTRLRWADIVSHPANRTGFSIRCSVRIASPNDTTTIANRPAKPRVWPNSAGASSSTGQCHRYHEYDSRPIERIAGFDKKCPTPKSGVAQPAPITNAVPSTGNNAVVPGYGVDPPTCVQVTTINARPPQPTSAAGGPGRCRHAPAVNATSPPTANSHARVGSEKNAHDGQLSVHDNDSMNDTAASAASASRYGATDRDAAVPL